MRDLITTAFEVCGLVLLVVAAALAVCSAVSVPAGLAVAGVLSLGCSALIVRTSSRPKPNAGSEVA